MSTLLIHAGRALTPMTEINDAGILIREDSIEAIGPRSGMTLPAGAQEVRATDKTAIPGFIDVHIYKTRDGRLVRGANFLRPRGQGHPRARPDGLNGIFANQDARVVNLCHRG